MLKIMLRKNIGYVERADHVWDQVIGKDGERYFLNALLHPISLSVFLKDEEKKYSIDNLNDFEQIKHILQRLLTFNSEQGIKQKVLLNDITALLELDVRKLTFNEKDLISGLLHSAGNNYLDFQVLYNDFICSSEQVLIFASEHDNYWDYLFLMRFLSQLNSKGGISNIIIEGLAVELTKSINALRSKFVHLDEEEKINLFEQFISSHPELHNIIDFGNHRESSGIVLTSLIRRLIFESLDKGYRVLCPGIIVKTDQEQYLNYSNRRLVRLIPKGQRAIIMVGAAHIFSQSQFGLSEMLRQAGISHKVLRMITINDEKFRRQEKEFWRLSRDENVFTLTRGL